MGICSLSLVTRIIAWLNLVITFLSSVLGLVILVYAVIYKVDLRLYFLNIFVLLFVRLAEFVTAIILVIYTAGEKEIKVTFKWLHFWFVSNLMIFLLRLLLFKWAESIYMLVELVNRFLSVSLILVFMEQPFNIMSISIPIKPSVYTISDDVARSNVV